MSTNQSPKLARTRHPRLSATVLELVWTSQRFQAESQWLINDCQALLKRSQTLREESQILKETIQLIKEEHRKQESREPCI